MAEPASTSVPDDDARLRNALRAHIAQTFVAPAASIVGYTDILIEDARQLGFADYLPDLEKIRNAGMALQRLLDGALAQDTDNEDVESYRTKLRHDLRTPINAVKGYGEMIAEDAADAGNDAFIPDLQKLLAAADDMLAHIDTLVAFTGHYLAGEDRKDAALADSERVLDAIKALNWATPAKSVSGRVLVVDDNASNRDLLARRLTREGHSVEAAASGLDAFLLLERQSFDLILLDILMPDMSGFEVLGRLKQNEKSRDIPVIMISALDGLDSIARCIEAGAVDYLPKPFDPTILRARINSCLETKFLRDREREMMEEIRIAKERNEALLLSILPKTIVDRINAGATMVADHIPEATILFADLVEFTPFARQLSASDLVGFLNRVFSAFDRLAEQFGAEKIKTIGDAYMAALGIPEPRDDHAEAGAHLAAAMIRALEGLKTEQSVPVKLRIGIHTGPAVAGVIGERKFAYDVWGSTVNIASRMESHGAPGRIHVSDAFAQRIDGKFRLSPRGPIEVKGAGTMQTFFLELD